MIGGQFEAKKALREEIEGLRNISTTLTTQTRRAQMEMGEAEAKYNALTKLDAFVRGEIERKQNVLLQISEAEQKR